GKAIVAYWLAAHSLPGNTFRTVYSAFTLKNTGIQHPVLIDVVSGDIRPLEWKQGTTDTLEALPVSDSIMAIADADYFDWPVLPEAPSSLNVASAGNVVKLSWQVHGGDPQHIVVERREESSSARGSWQRIAELPPSAMDYIDSRVQKGQQLAYRVRATNAGGESASSNIVRITAP
ncbi:MAG TPA: fibronectin type III domain-containing protein, partial [Candidatus Sulfotelmatobacter sp.]|nr:fibronectin type III domain-containing protein [Candidatus Sulfotelmatobacter sp.]